MSAHRIQAALAFVPAHDRETWVKMAMAVKSELGDGGFPIWDEWSRTDERYKERDAKHVWDSVRPDGKVTIGSLYHEAKQRGYKPVNGEHPSAAEIERRKKEAAERAQNAGQEEQQRHEQGRLKAQAEIAGRPYGKEVHPYLARKKVKPFKIYETADGRLAIPMRDVDGKLWSVQFISPDGEKRFLKDARAKGLYFGIGKPEGKIIVAEGYATGASIHQCTGDAVAIAFSLGNILPVTKALRQKYPNVEIVIAADSSPPDSVTKANEAAIAVNGKVAVPILTDGSGKDFNDLMIASGADAVSKQIASAQTLDPPNQPESSGIKYRCMSDIEAKPVRWLWPGRIARGKASMIAGHPGLGKSQITASLAAIVSTGGMWPVDRTRAEVGNVIFLSAEDDPEDTIRPRLEAAGADLNRIYMLDAVREERDDGEPLHRAFSLKKDLSRLGNLLAEIGDVAMIVIDPITAYLGGVETHYNADVRAALAPLSDLAAKHGVAVVCVSHLNKGGGGGSDALMRVTGSIAFVAAARAAYLVVKDDEDESRRLFLPLKNNLGDDKTGLAFSLQSHVIDGGIPTCRVLWETAAVDVSADQALAQQAVGDKSELDETKEFLQTTLGGGKVLSKEIDRDAEANGISRATLRRAKKALGVKAVKEGVPGESGKWYWRLPYPDEAPKMLKTSEDAQEIKVSTFGENEHLRDGDAGRTEAFGV